MKRYWLLFALLFVLPTVASASKPQLAENLAPTHGYVYVSFPKGGSVQLLTLQSVADKTNYKLQARTDAGKSAFGLWVPAGEYRVSKWLNHKWGDYPTIQVVAGRVTDLGSLIPLSIGGYDIVVLPVRHPEVAHDVESAINQYRSILASTEPVQWLPATPPTPITLDMPSTGLGLIADLIMLHDRKVNKPSINTQLREATSVTQFHRLAMESMPPLTGEFAVDAAGSLYYGADLGQVRVRNPDGDWGSLDTGTLQTISAVESKDNLLLAGSKDGILRGSNDNGITWRVLKTLPSDEAIVDIDYASGRWLLSTSREPTPRAQTVIVSSEDGTDLIRIYAARADDFADLSIIKEFPVKPRKFVEWLGPQSQAAGNFYYLTVWPAFYRLDLDSMEWRTITPPKEVSKFYVSPGTGVVSTLRAQGFPSKLFVSVDHGDSWNRYEVPSNVQSYILDSADTGWAVRWEPSAFSVALQILNYNRASNTWIKIDEAPRGCSRVMRNAHNEPKFCVTSGGSILSKENQVWTVEYATE